MQIPVPIEAAMAPTTYVSISIIQPHSQTLNDRPLRMYGVVPLNIEDPATHQTLRLKMPDELRPNEDFKIDIETTDRRQTQFTIAVVDEGLLDITRFPTPDPWMHFFQKLRLGVSTFDLFSFIIGANKGDVFRTFSIGGGLAAAYRDSQLDDDKKNRFKPVSMFKGPLMTDENGKATVEFTMPNYVGSVRVMAVSANKNQYGNLEKTVPVKTELMVVPSLPRVVGPEDKFSIPATVFAMKENLGNVDVRIDVEGPLKVSNAAAKQLTFTNIGEQDVFFDIDADLAIGPAKITITAQSGNYSSTHETDIEVRPSSPRIYTSEDKTVLPDQPMSLTIPDRGIPGSNFASLVIARRPNLNLANRLRWLMRYPYGCLEQTTSAVFPQLYLKDFLRDPEISGKPLTAEQYAAQIDHNINSAIRRFSRFQTASGGFAYWPGSGSVNPWSNNYAGHFLIEAKRLGYHVPQDLFDNWLRYMQSKAMSTREHLLTRVYRVYLLALAGAPEVGAMNLLKENNQKDMKDRELWYLGASYQLAGIEKTAQNIIATAGRQVTDYQEFSNTYGSGLRDRAIILELQTTFGNWAAADELAQNICETLSGDQWYSTHSIGYSLMAVGKYLNALEVKAGSTPKLLGTITLPNGEKIDFDTEERIFSVDFDEGFGENITIDLDSRSSLNRAFATLSWNGVPIKSDVKTANKNMQLKVRWLNEDGMEINPATLKQGTAFWGHFNVSTLQNSNAAIDEVALVQVLPAGWEIENIRLSGQDMPAWMRNWHLNTEEYLDIRDDRIMWFFDLRRRYNRRRSSNSNQQTGVDFVVKLSAVTVGEFNMPPTLTEAMYNNNYQATKAGGKVTVTAR